jgi:hypothetical protein
LKSIQKLLSQIEAQKKSIDRLHADHTAAQSTIENAGAHAATIADLKRERRRIMAEAMIAKKTANTASVDVEIANAEALHSAAHAAANTARDAIDIIAEGERIAQAGMDGLQEQLREAIAVEIVSHHDIAQQKYLAAVAALEEGVSGMVAAQRAWQYARTSLGNVPFPGHGEMVLDEIRTKGLRVPHTASRLADPIIASQYTPDYPNYWYLPAWADPLTQGFADDETRSIVASLRAAGIDCDLPRTAPPPEKQVKVRILRGTVQASDKVIRSAASGEIIKATSVSFGPGEDVLLDESMARKMRANRLVAIHGEDEMPSDDAGGPIRIDASPPKESLNGRGNEDLTGSYRYPLDLSAYE